MTGPRFTRGFESISFHKPMGPIDAARILERDFGDAWTGWGYVPDSNQWNREDIRKWDHLRHHYAAQVSEKRQQERKSARFNRERQTAQEQALKDDVDARIEELFQKPRPKPHDIEWYPKHHENTLEFAAASCFDHLHGNDRRMVQECVANEVASIDDYCEDLIEECSRGGFRVIAAAKAKKRERLKREREENAA